jgi:hypothetical protein
MVFPQVDEDEDGQPAPPQSRKTGEAQAKKEKTKNEIGKEGEEEVHKPKNKRAKNPILAEASTELSQAYVPPAPAPAPVQRQSTRLRRSRNPPKGTQPQVELTGEQIAQIERDEEVARHIAEKETGGLGPFGAQPTLQERMIAEEKALEKSVRKSTRHRNRSTTPATRTKFQTEAELAQEHLDSQHARQEQRKEGLAAGLGHRGEADASDDDDADIIESSQKVRAKYIKIPLCSLIPIDREAPRQHRAFTGPREDLAITPSVKASTVCLRRSA